MVWVGQRQMPCTWIPGAIYSWLPPGYGPPKPRLRSVAIRLRRLTGPHAGITRRGQRRLSGRRSLAADGVETGRVQPNLPEPPEGRQAVLLPLPRWTTLLVVQGFPRSRCHRPGAIRTRRVSSQPGCTWLAIFFLPMATSNEVDTYTIVIVSARADESCGAASPHAWTNSRRAPCVPTGSGRAESRIPSGSSTRTPMPWPRMVSMLSCRLSTATPML